MSSRCVGAPNRGTTVHITGGLGNQLFQLAAALHVARDGPVHLLTSFGLGRTSEEGKLDVSSMTLPRSASTLSIQLDSLEHRVISRVLSGGLRDSTRRLPGTVRSLKNRQRALALKVGLRKSGFLGHQIHIASNVGFDPKVMECPRNSLLVGYFQTWRYPTDPSVFQKLRMMVASSRSGKWLDHLQQRSGPESPVIVHVRLGDYKRIPDFGTVTREYLKRALQTLGRERELGRIWLFSDEPVLATQMIENLEFTNSVRVVHPPSTSVSSAQVLRAMTLGQAYVISNSTFGWWGAFLTDNQSAPVIAPQPWFVGQKPIRELIPGSWRSVDRA